MDATQIGYFLLSMFGGLCVIAIPWSGIILLNAKSEKRKATK
jgi:hypothetical protein